MRHYFFDTSALVKHYHAETGSSQVDLILRESGAIFSRARLTLTEVPSVFAKKVRTKEIAEAAFDGLRLRFFADVGDRVVLPARILNAHFETAGNLISKHGKTRPIHTPSMRFSLRWRSRSNTRPPSNTSVAPISGSATSPRSKGWSFSTPSCPEAHD